MGIGPPPTALPTTVLPVRHREEEWLDSSSYGSGRYRDRAGNGGGGGGGGDGDDSGRDGCPPPGGPAGGGGWWPQGPHRVKRRFSGSLQLPPLAWRQAESGSRRARTPERGAPPPPPLLLPALVWRHAEMCARTAVPAAATTTTAATATVATVATVATAAATATADDGVTTPGEGGGGGVARPTSLSIVPQISVTAADLER
ncbi:unnamed protein product [Lampetra fluviatilis]